MRGILVFVMLAASCQLASYGQVQSTAGQNQPNPPSAASTTQEHQQAVQVQSAQVKALEANADYNSVLARAQQATISSVNGAASALTALAAVQSSPQLEINVIVEHGVTRDYPSLKRRPYIHIRTVSASPKASQQTTRLLSALSASIKATVSAEQWEVVKLSSSGQARTKDALFASSIGAISIETEKANVSKRFAVANVNVDTPGDIWMELSPGAFNEGGSYAVVPKGIVPDTLTAESLKADTAGVLITTDPRPFEKYTFSITPSEVPSQELLDGTTHSVHHLDLNFENPILFKKGGGNRAYLASQSLISSNSLDKAAKLDLKTGFLWYLERATGSDSSHAESERNIFLDMNGYGNQQLSYSVLDVTAGFRNIFGSGPIPSMLRSVVAADAWPHLEFGAQGERRFRQDSRVTAVHSKSSVFKLEGEFEWKPILFPTYSKADDGSSKVTGVLFHALAQGWYISDDEANVGLKPRRFEGRIVLRMLVPLGDAINKLLAKDAGTGIYIKWQDGANPQNGYTRTSDFSVGFEAVKTF